MAEHDFQGDEVDESLAVQYLTQPLPTLAGVGLRGGLHQSIQIRTIRNVISGIGVQVPVDVPQESSIIEIAPHVSEVPSKKRLSPPFSQHVEAKVAAVDQHGGVVRPGHGNA